ncbi:MAG: alpha/beta hydrolase [Rhodobacter sp.]|nr:alpha/beta hydrolase [Rhodobacter sp.]
MLALGGWSLGTGETVTVRLGQVCYVYRAAGRVIAFCALCLAASACNRIGYGLDAVRDPPTREVVVTPDGNYSLYSITTGPSDPAGPDRAVYFIGGSGCASLSVYLTHYFRGFPGGYRVYALEKEGVSPGGFGFRCSADFWKTYTLDRMTERNREMLQFVMDRHGTALAGVMGTSEGGPIAVKLAASRPDIPRLAVIGAGGMTMREVLKILARRRGQDSELNTLLSQIDQDPLATDRFVLGLTHAYWTSVLDVDPTPDLKALRGPVLVVIGAQDQNVPVESARKAAAVLRNGDLWEVEGADHVFNSPTGNRRAEVMQAVGQFFGTP